jgi:hypothetical protein
MKYYIQATFGFLFLSCATQALEFQTYIDAGMQNSESKAFDSALALAKEINAGKNDEALSEAAIECPEDNDPKMIVNRIKMKTYWLPDATSVTDKKYKGSVNYSVNCSHNSRGGNR